MKSSEFVNGIAAGVGIQMSAGAGIKNSCSSFSCTHWSAKEMDQNRETTVSLTSKGEDFGKAKGGIAGNIKGRDFGYALAALSCEGVNSVESCTITALDVITAFAVQTPTAPRRVSRFFRVWSSFRLPRRTDHSAYFGLTRFI